MAHAPADRLYRHRPPRLPAHALGVGLLLVLCGPGCVENVMIIGPSPREPSFVFAVIGDYGASAFGEDSAAASARVAALVHSWEPQHVFTLGDNNYPDGEQATIDLNIGQHYARYIGSYIGNHGRGSAENRFWPAVGNHDWGPGGLGPYLDYFVLPGNERYYTAKFGLVELFVLDTYLPGVDNPQRESYPDDWAEQKSWLASALDRSTACFKLVTGHASPYTTGHHSPAKNMRWDFSAWGADVVMTGHNHGYERFNIDGVRYVVNGLGGTTIHPFGETIGFAPITRYNANHGAIRGMVTDSTLTFEFHSVSDGVEDTLAIEKDCAPNNMAAERPVR
ncbi:MAG: metallophosphoesterase [Nannocystaceae bacterium]